MARTGFRKAQGFSEAAPMEPSSHGAPESIHLRMAATSVALSAAPMGIAGWSSPLMRR
jgi:hypothetical protein